MPKGKKSKQPRKSERLEWKFSYRVSRRVYPDPIAAKAAIEIAREEFLETGDPDAIKGIHVTGLWRNPDNNNPRHRQWKTSDDPDQSPSGFIKTIMERTGRI
jgi:hypothetical protein